MRSSSRATSSSASVRRTSCAGSKRCSRRVRQCALADPVAALAAELSDLAGTDVELERPSDAAHGDYATNVALRLAGTRRLPPREIAAELATSVATLPHVAGAEVAGPGF